MSQLSAAPPRLRVLLPSASIFLAAFLVFALEPLVAKRILPWFGGSAAVWSTCLVFYQTALLIGYGYANTLVGWNTRLNSGRQLMALHIAIVLASLAFLPIGPGPSWSHLDVSHPVWQIMGMLVLTVGLPFAVLSSTNPLLQAWAARAGDRVPYRLFALSNLASLCALVAYPLLIEPEFSVRTQVAVWSSLYLVYDLFVAGTAGLMMRSAKLPTEAAQSDERRYILPWQWLSWFALSACGSMLLLAVTNHITANVAAVPLLWVLPLTIYLLTFIVAFARKRPLGRALWLRLLAFALGVLAYSIYDVNAISAVQVSIPVFLAGLYICCYYCHGELNALRPETGGLTTFYLAIAAGGAAGAITAGIIAPSIFSGVYDLPVVLALTAILATVLIWRSAGWTLRVLWLGVTACMAATVANNVHAFHENTLTLRRSFYGSLRVTQSPHAGPEQIRTLFHGTIEHGAQHVQLPERLRPGTYYGPDSGIGILLREYPKSPKRVAIVGLGTGTVAAFGKAGDNFRFFEINRQVIDIAESLFTYLRESRAHVDVIEGDGRLALERDPGPRFDVIVLDAFSGDAIPVHLLTQEAMTIYRRHLEPGGTIAVHVSNDFLDLPPVVKQLANAIGFHAILVHSHEDVSEGLLPSDWMLVTQNLAIRENSSVRVHSVAVNNRPDLPLWTDDYNNLLQILKVPHWQ